ncbi:MAG: 2-amino-4-hydroxy-6-hydroxymethyldihydropteridine diphosphokinase [Burkholderiales bacterium]
MKQHTAYIALGSNIGSNLGNPQKIVVNAIKLLGDLRDTEVLERSSLYRTAPMGYTDQPDFINACVKIATGLTARQLMVELQKLEKQHGRERKIVNGPRTLDLDILLFDDLRHDEHGLILPHPRMHERAFVLMPLLEIFPDATIPDKGSVKDLLARCKNQEIEKIN